MLLNTEWRLRTEFVLCHFGPCSNSAQEGFGDKTQHLYSSWSTVFQAAPQLQNNVDEYMQIRLKQEKMHLVQIV